MPLEQILSTKSAWPTVVVDGRALHSRYDPLAEAEKFARALAPDGPRRFYLLIECGLEYIVPFVRRAAGGGRLISLHVSDFFLTAAGAPARGHAADARWSPACGPLDEFLAARIPDTEAAHVKLIEWRPSRAAYGAAYARLLARTVAFIKRGDANKRTLIAFGRRWFLNSLRNAALLRNAPPPAPRLPYGPGGCLVAGAGPSLDRDLPAIRRAVRGDGLLVVAVCQAAAALREGGVEPALLVTSDGGNWAPRHFFSCVRAWPSGRRPPLAASLRAALPGEAAGFGAFALAESRYQAALLEHAGVPGIGLPSAGTVSAAAAGVALRLTAGPVWTAGMDMAVCDIKTHARGYAFNALLREKSGRLSPYHSRQFERAREMEGGGSLGIYARWFEGFRAENRGRLLPFAEYRPARGNGGGGMLITPQAARRGGAFTARDAACFLVRRMREGGEGEAMRREVSELLFEGDTEKSVEDIEDAAFSLCGKAAGGTV